MHDAALGLERDEAKRGRSVVMSQSHISTIESSDVEIDSACLETDSDTIEPGFDRFVA